MNRLETARLLLRPLTPTDAPAIYQLGADRAVMQYIGSPLLQNEAQALAYLLEKPLADYQRDGFGRLAVVERQSGQVIGFCGIKYVPELAAYDLGYRLRPEYWGLGYMTEACRAVMVDGKARGLTELIALVHPDNQSSCRLLQKLGFVLEKTVAYSILPGIDVLQFRLSLVSAGAEVVA